MSEPAPREDVPTASHPAAQRERAFYLVAGCVCLALVLIAFRQFYLHGTADDGGEVTRPIAALVFAHGIGMSAWILLFVVQAALIVRGQHRRHVALGVAGSVLAALLVVLGVVTALLSVHLRPEVYEGLWGASRFLLLMLVMIVMFGALVGVAVVQRHRPAVHRPLMLVATLFVTAGATIRLHGLTGWLLHLAPESILLGFWSPVLVLGAVLWLLKLLMTRTWDGTYALGYASMWGASIVSVVIANSAAWRGLARLVTSG